MEPHREVRSSRACPWGAYWDPGPPSLPVSQLPWGEHPPLSPTLPLWSLAQIGSKDPRQATMGWILWNHRSAKPFLSKLTRLKYFVTVMESQQIQLMANIAHSYWENPEGNGAETSYIRGQRARQVAAPRRLPWVLWVKATTEVWTWSQRGLCLQYFLLPGFFQLPFLSQRGLKGGLSLSRHGSKSKIKCSHCFFLAKANQLGNKSKGRKLPFQNRTKHVSIKNHSFLQVHRTKPASSGKTGLYFWQ